MPAPAEPETLQPLEIPGEGGWVAGDVDQPPRGQTVELLAHPRIHAGSRWVHDHHIGGCNSRSRSSTLPVCRFAAGPFASASATARRSISTLSTWPPSQRAARSSHRCPRRDPTPVRPDTSRAAPGQRRGPDRPSRDEPARTRWRERPRCPRPRPARRPPSGWYQMVTGMARRSSSRRSRSKPSQTSPSPTRTSTCRPPLRSRRSTICSTRGGRKGRNARIARHSSIAQAR